MGRSLGSSLFFLFALSCPALALDVQSLAAPKNQEVWYVSDHTLPMIVMTVALPAGSAYDPPGKPGLANFAAQLLDEGAGNLRADAFQMTLANRAVRLTIAPERDDLVVTLVTLSANAKEAFQLLGMALSHPRFDADAIARVRAQIQADLADQDDDPAAVAEKGFYRAFFGDHPYGHPIIGTTAGISSINAADLHRFAAGHWVSRGLKVAVSGDVDRATLTALLKSAFGSLPAGGPRSLPPVSHTGKPGVSVIAMAVPQPNAVFGLPGVLRSDPQYLAGFVANYILGGGGFASRLTNEVREKRGLTYDVSTSLESFRKSGFVLGQVATKRGSMKETVAVIRAALKDFAQNGPTDRELADAKTYLTGSYPLAFSSNGGTSDQLSTFQRVGLDVAYVQNRNALINAVTLDQLKQAAKRLFDPSRLTVVVAGSNGSPAPSGSRTRNPPASGGQQSSLH
ncbi:MAG TPA: pitrilysin family protein [Rhizomicrobium sp.]|nr:pitrilysin family protein [Rhizomicrobium sp.]